MATTQTQAQIKPGQSLGTMTLLDKLPELFKKYHPPGVDQPKPARRHRRW
jgi:hypothetical protein